MATKKKPAAKKPAAKKAPTKKAPAKKATKPESPLLAQFPPLPPKPPETGVLVPTRGQPGSWDDVFDKLSPEPPTPSLATSHWSDGKQIVVRFEPDGKVTFAASGGVSKMGWQQRGPWLLVVVEDPSNGRRTVETLLRVGGDIMAGYQRSMYGIVPCEYRRTGAGAQIDEHIRAINASNAWMVGPRDTPAPQRPTWPSRLARWSAAPSPSQSSGPLRFANHRAARSLAAMKPAERKYLADYKETLAQQAEFGGIEAIDLLDGTTVAYHLYWWPFTDGILVDASSGEVVADLLDGTLTIEDAALRARIDTAYHAARADGALPSTLSITLR